MKKLDLSKCKTNDEVCELVKKQIKLLSYEEVLEEVSKKFVYQERATKAIYLGLSTNMNVFLSGPSGFGKSSLAKFILDLYKIPYSTVIGYKDMSVDALLGVPDMDKLLKSSEYIINFNKSIFSQPGILIGEEFTDILPKTASVLKDILSEKGYRHKTGKDESLIANMIVLANKSPVEITEDESTRALYVERFPIKAVVKWNNYTTLDYLNLFKCTFPKGDPKLLHFIASLYETNHSKYQNTISPRVAIEAANIYLTKGIDFLEPMDINLTDIEAIKLTAERDFITIKLTKGLKGVIEYIQDEEDSVQKQLKCLYALHLLRKISAAAPEALNILDTINKVQLEYFTTIDKDNDQYKQTLDVLLTNVI